MHGALQNVRLMRSATGRARTVHLSFRLLTMHALGRMWSRRRFVRKEKIMKSFGKGGNLGHKSGKEMKGK